MGSTGRCKQCATAVAFKTSTGIDCLPCDELLGHEVHHPIVNNNGVKDQPKGAAERGMRNRERGLSKSAQQVRVKDGASDLFVDIARAEGKESCNGLNTAPGKMRHVGMERARTR